MQFECGTRILRVIHGRDARATSENCITTRRLQLVVRLENYCLMTLRARARATQLFGIEAVADPGFGENMTWRRRIGFNLFS